MRGHEGFSRKVRDPVTDLIMKRHDEASLFAVKGMTD